MNEIQKLIRIIRDSESEFYRKRWNDAEKFEELPLVSRRDLVATPLSERRYKDEKGLVKIVHTAEGDFLVEWSFADIGQEMFGVSSNRPMVYMDNPHESIEKSMWCYESNMVPLIGEKDPDIAAFAAERYEVDSLITDEVALQKLMPMLSRRSTLLESISVLGDSFDVDALGICTRWTRHLRLVLALPELGAFAEANYDQHPRFTPISGCTVEQEDTLIVTKDRLLTTPVVRYKTEIPADVYGA